MVYGGFDCDYIVVGFLRSIEWFEVWVVVTYYGSALPKTSLLGRSWRNLSLEHCAVSDEDYALE